MILNEDRFLNEAFNNIPDWLKQYLSVQNKLSTISSKDRQFLPRNSRNKGGWNEGLMTYDGKTFTVERGHFSNRKSDDLYWKSNKYTGRMNLTAGLFNSLRAAGVNLSRMQVIETEKPQKASDNRLKEPNIPIFLLFDGRYSNSRTEGVCQAYAKGINDDELCNFSKEKDGKRLGTLSMKFLLEKCIAFAYFDSSDTSNFMDDVEIDKRIKRDEETPVNSPNERLPKGILNRIEDGSTMRYKDTNYGYEGERGWQIRVDKSGYAKPILPANVDDYEGGSDTWYTKFRDPKEQKKYDKIKEKSVTNIDNIVDMYNDVLNDYKNTLRYSSWLDSSDKDISKQRNGNIKGVKEKIQELKQYISNLEKIKSNLHKNGDDNDTISTNYEVGHELKKCYDLVKEIKSLLGIYYKPDHKNEYDDYAELDWD